MNVFPLSATPNQLPNSSAFDNARQTRERAAVLRRLRELNPHVEVETVAENVSADNVERLMDGIDLVVSTAPRFGERLALNREAVRRGRPLVDCAMYELEAQVTTILP